MEPALDDLAARVRALADVARRQRRRAVVGIAGAPGAGKSTLASTLTDALNADPPTGESAGWVAHVPMDGFHLADIELDRLGLRHCKGAPETFDAHGYVALLQRLRGRVRGETIYAPSFERTLEQPVAGAVPVTEGAWVVITEGNYLLLSTGPWVEVRGLLDEAWFCKADDAVRRERLVARHVGYGKSEAGAIAWVDRCDEPNAALVATTGDAADLVVRCP